MKTNIAEVIGEKSYLRLKERKLITPAAIKKTSPGTIMSVAGIGPKKAVELYQTIGVKLDEREIETIYNKLKNKTRFSRFKEGYKKLMNDPRPAIQKLEDTKKEIILWQNFLGHTRNIGRTEKDRVPILDYRPQSLVLDPFSMENQQETELYAEVFINATEGGAEIVYEARDNAHGRSTKTTDFVAHTNSVAMVQKIGDVIQLLYRNYRAQTLAGSFTIILDNEYDIFLDTLSNRFRNERNRVNIIVEEQYKNYEILNKYLANPLMDEVLDRFDEYHTYMLFDKYKRKGGKLDYEKWNAQNEYGFIDIIKDQEPQRSYIKLETQGLGFTALFGALMGMEDIGDDYKETSIPSISIPFERDTGYVAYSDLKLKLGYKIEGVNLSPIMAALVHATLDETQSKEDFKTYVYNNTLIFESKSLPGIGFLYTPKEE